MKTLAFLPAAMALVVAGSPAPRPAPRMPSRSATPNARIACRCRCCRNTLEGATVEAPGFNTGNDVLTALLSKSIDVAQVTDSITTGSTRASTRRRLRSDLRRLDHRRAERSPGRPTTAGLKALIAKYKAEGKPFRIAASRGKCPDYPHARR